MLFWFALDENGFFDYSIDMEDKFFNLFNDGTTLITHCPICSVRYDPLEAKILDEDGPSHLVYIKCRNCASAVLAVIVTNNMGVSSIGLITDLSSDDVVKFREKEAINPDDVIEAHEFFNKEKVLIDHFD